VFNDFQEDASKKTKQASEQVDKVITEVKEVIILYGEDENTKPTEFFELFSNFNKEAINCYKHVQLQEKLKKEEEEKKKEGKLKQSKTMGKGGAEGKKNIFKTKQ